MPSSRRRLGVALLLDEPVRSEVEGLRRAVGDPSLGRMDPHITLVPPVNVRTADLPKALSLLRSAAAGQPGPLLGTFGPPGTFLPDNPVLYLQVGGDLERLAGLRDAVFHPPLARSLTWPWVPHITVGDGVPEERIRDALGVLGGYVAAAHFDRVVLLEEQRGRSWVPIADACLEPKVTVGTGGMAVEITRGRVLDPEILALLGRDRPSDARAAGAEGQLQAATTPVFPNPIVVSARTGGEPVGSAFAWVDLSGPHVAVFVAGGRRRQGVGGHLLAHLEHAARSAGWDFEVLLADGPAGFYESRSAWARSPSPAVTRTRRTSTGSAS